MIREIGPAPHRPKTRRFINLTNTELALMLKHRTEEVYERLHEHRFWENDRIVYWNAFSSRIDNLYEVMLEIQSRYPESECKGIRLLPVIEPTEVRK